MLGGTQSLHCNGRDEALALPTEESARIALRTQQIIAAESGVANTVDPVAGSYAIETLTNTIEQEAQDILARIDRAGGTLAAIESGLIQREVQESAFRAQQAIDAGRSLVVGVNKFAEQGAAIFSPPLFQIDPEVEARQIARLRALREGRDQETFRQALAAVTTAASDGTTSCRPSWRRSKRARPSGRSPTRCEVCSVNSNLRI